ncbi:MAG: alanine dehydrogenase, partial [Thermoleophilaceae bacterium]
YALTNATMPYLLKLADRGFAALHDDPGFLAGLNVRAGHVTYAPVAEAVDVELARPESMLAA